MMVGRMMRGIMGLVLLGVMVPLTGAQDLPKEQFLLTFIPNIQFAPVYVAIEKGYFAYADMDVSVEYLNEPDVLDLVASGQNNFGIVSAEQVILAGAQGRPISYVYNWFQKYPVGIVYNANAGITSVADLAGKSVGIPGRFGTSYSGLTTILTANGLSESDIDLQEIGFNAPEVFCLGQVDAAVVYINNEPLQISNRIQSGDCGDVQEIGVFAVSDYVDLVSNGVITNQALLENDPAKVQAFVTAYHLGLQDAINNPAEAYLLSVAHVENLPLSDAFKTELEALAKSQGAFLATEPSREAIQASRVAMRKELMAKFGADELVQFEVLLNTIALWDGEQLGMSDPQAWENMRDILISLNALTQDVDLSKLYTNQFACLLTPSQNGVCA
jgi:NitT/TauT family transport system substrate-binding protein